MGFAFPDLFVYQADTSAFRTGGTDLDPERANFSTLLIRQLQDPESPLYWKKSGACFVSPGMGGIAVGNADDGRPSLSGFDVQSPHIQAGTRRWCKPDLRRAFYGFERSGVHPSGPWIVEADALVRGDTQDVPTMCENIEKGRLVMWRSEAMQPALDAEKYKEMCALDVAHISPQEGEVMVGKRLARELRLAAHLFSLRIFHGGPGSSEEAAGVPCHAPLQAATGICGLLPNAARGTEAMNIMCYRSGYLKSFSDAFQLTEGLGRENFPESVRNPAAWKDAMWWRDRNVMSYQATCDYVESEILCDARALSSTRPKAVARPAAGGSGDIGSVISFQPPGR